MGQLLVQQGSGILNPLPILQGGTGATSASSARTNLGLGTGDSPAFAGLSIDSPTFVVDSVNHRIGIGTVTPSYPVEIVKAYTAIVDNDAFVRVIPTITLAGNSSGDLIGIQSGVTIDQNGFNATDSTAAIRGIQSNVFVSGASGTVTKVMGTNSLVVSSGLGTLTTGYCYHAQFRNIGGGAITTGYGFYSLGSNSGTVDNYYGLRIEANALGTITYGISSGIVAGTNQWNLYLDGTAQNYIAGNVGIGVTTPTNALSFGGNTSRIIWMERHTTSNTAGNDLGIQAGGATVGSTDKTGGTLALRAGASTGTGSGSISFQTPTPQASTSTSDNAASEKMVLLGNGNLGIAVTTPLSKFVISYAPAAGAPTLTAANWGISLISTTTAAVGAGPSIEFSGQSGNSIASYPFGSIQASKDNVTAADYGSKLTFYTIGSAGGQTEHLRIDQYGNVLISANVAGSGVTVPASFTLTNAAHLALTASTERLDTNFNSARTVQWAAGALTTQRFNLFQAPTIAFDGSSTVTDTATVAITGAPKSGTNATLSATHALLIQAGAVTAGTAAYGLTVNAPTGGTANYSAQFLGGNVGIGTSAPTNDLSFGGNAARTIWMERHTTSNTAGNSLTVQAGGATSGATDKAGGPLNLSSGTATGTGSAGIAFYTSTAQGTTNTTDNAPTVKMTILGSGNVGIGVTGPSLKFQVSGQIVSGSQTMSAKFNSQGVDWTTVGATIPSLLFNEGATDRPEIAWYRGTRTYPEFAIRQHTSADTGGELYVGPGTAAPTLLIAFATTGFAINGQANKTFSLIRNTTADTAGASLSVIAGGATISAADRVGGDLILSAGLGTGTAAAPQKVRLRTYTNGAASTTDNATIDIATASINGFELLNNNTAFNTTLTNPVMYSTSSGGVSYPFLTAGNLVFQSRPSGASRDIVFVTGTSQNITMVLDGTNNRVGLLTATPSATFSFASEATRTIFVERRTTSDSAGSGLVIESGGATSGATDKAGGALTLRSGLGTGTGSGNVQFSTYTPALASGTSDNTASIKLILSANGTITQSVAVSTGTVGSMVSFNDAAHTALTLSTERISANFNMAKTFEWATGALTTQRFALFQAPTIGFVGASTVTDAATVAITGAVIKGTNATVTNSHALLIQAGAVSTVGSSYGLTVNAQTGGSANYSAQFLGGNVGIGTSAPTNDLSFGGNAARTVWMERHTTANTAGTSLTVKSGSATSGAINKNGGDLILSSGISTGSGTSNIQFLIYPGTAGATSDNTAIFAVYLSSSSLLLGGTTPLELSGATSGTIKLKAAATGGLVTITLPAGTTDFSATGGTSQVVKQTSAGGAFTVAQLAASDLSNGTSGSGAVVLVTGAVLVTPTLGAATGTSLVLSGALTASDITLTKNSAMTLTWDEYLSSGTAIDWRIRKARGTSSVPTASVGGDQIVSLLFGAYGGSGAFRNPAGMSAVVAGQVSGSTVPVDLIFGTGQGTTSFAPYSTQDRLNLLNTGDIQMNGNLYVANRSSVGSEKVTNGTFTGNDTGWTAGAGWAYSSNNELHTAGNTADLEQSVSAVVGEAYLVTLTVASMTAGNVFVTVGGGVGPALSQNATINFVVIATTTGNLKVTPTTDFDGTVDTISCKRVNGGVLNAASGLAIGSGYMGVAPPTSGAIISGNVGIGITSPTQQVEIQSATAPYLRVSNTGSATPEVFFDLFRNTGDAAVFRLAPGGGGLHIGTTHTAGDITFHTVSNMGLTTNTRMSINEFGNVAIGASLSNTALLSVFDTASTGTVLPALLITSAAHTALTASTERFDVRFNSARTVQWVAGTLTTQRFNLFSAPTIAFDGAATVTDTATVAISGAVVKGTNATVTNSHALLIQAGAVSTVGSSYGLTVNTQTGGTANYAAQFLGGNVGIGISAPVSLLHVAGIESSAVRGMVIGHHTSNTNQAILILRKSRGGAVTTPSIITTGDKLGSIVFEGYDGAAYLQMGGITVTSIGTIATDRVPTTMSLQTATDAATSVLTTALYISEAQNIGIKTTAPTNDLSFGGNAARILWMERHSTSNTAGNSLSVQSGGATSGATDKAAGDLIVKPGLSTGNAVPGRIRLQGTAAAPATGTGDQTNVDRFTPNAFKVLTNNSATTVISATVATGTGIGIIIDYCIEVVATIATVLTPQIEVGRVYVNAINLAGVITTVITETNSQQSLGSGTLATTWAASSANPCVISVNANSSLTPDSNYPRCTYSILNVGNQAIV